MLILIPPILFLTWSWKCCLLFMSAAYIQVHFRFYHGRKHYEPRSDCSLDPANTFLAWKCCLLFMSAAYIQVHFRFYHGRKHYGPRSDCSQDPANTFLTWKCCLLFISAAYIQVHIRFYHGSKHYGPRSDCSLGSSLIWVHIVCNNIIIQKREKTTSHDWWEKCYNHATTRLAKM